jgi:hypothetical protein
VCFSVGGLVGRGPWPHLLESSLWLPLLFLFLLRAMHAASRRRAGLYAAFAGLTLGMSILAGGLHVVMMQAIVLVTAAVYYALRNDAHGRLRSLVLAAAALGIGLAAGAIQLLPSMEYSSRAIRFVTGTSLPATQKIPYAYLQDYASPQALASYLLFSAFQDKPGPLAPGTGEVLNPYLGVFPLLLALIGIWKCRDNLWVRYSAGLAVAAFLFSLGALSLLYGLIYVIVPFLWMAREASRFLYLAHFGLVILAAFGAEELFAKAQAPDFWAGAKRVFGWLVIACMLVLAVSGIFKSAQMRPMMAFSILMILITYALFRYVAAGAQGTLARFLAVALILFDLSAFDKVAENKIEAARTDADHLERLQSMRGAADFLKSRPGPFRVEVVADPPLNPGDAYGLETLNGGAVTLAANYVALRNHVPTSVNLLNVRYFLRPASATDPAPVYADANWKVYENSQVYPRAWVVHQAMVEPVPEALLARLGTPGAQPDRVALLTAPLPVALEASSNGAAEVALVESDAGSRMGVKVRATSVGLLVLSEMYDPGWVALVNGRSERIYEVDGGLRGIVVPRGESQVILEYAPPSVRVGGMVSAIAFLGTLLAWIFLRRVA